MSARVIAALVALALTYAGVTNAHRIVPPEAAPQPEQQHCRT